MTNMNKGLYVSLMSGAISAKPVPAAVIEALSEAQVTSAATGQSGFQLKFTLGKNSEIARRLLPSGYFDPDRRIIISATVNGTPHVLIDGVITKQDVTPSNQAGASTLTLTGLDMTVWMDRLDLSDIPYPGLPISAIVLLILAKYAAYGIVPKVVPSVIDLLENPLERVRKQAGTDLAYLNALAEISGYVFYLEPGPRPGRSTAYWGPEIRYGTPQPALSINLDSAANVEQLSFAYDGLSRAQIFVTILEPMTKIPIPIPIPEVAILKPTLAKQTAVAMRSERLGGISNLSAPEAALRGLARAASASDAVTASGGLDVLRYGQVLSPRRQVAVRGAGQAYDGAYYVSSVTHDIRRGSYRQSFSLVRGGIKSTMARVPV